MSGRGKHARWNLRQRIRKARLNMTGTEIRSHEIDEVQNAIDLLDRIRSFGPNARLRINANGPHEFTIYDPTKGSSR
jgi:hypothetical protein